jgi:hypothetical protein
MVPPESKDSRPLKTIRFKQKLNYLLPYIEFNEGREIKLPIRRVIVGPSLDAERRVASIAIFMKENGYDVPVSLSEIPYA